MRFVLAVVFTLSALRSTALAQTTPQTAKRQPAPAAQKQPDVELVGRIETHMSDRYTDYRNKLEIAITAEIKGADRKAIQLKVRETDGSGLGTLDWLPITMNVDMGGICGENDSKTHAPVFKPYQWQEPRVIKNAYPDGDGIIRLVDSDNCCLQAGRAVSFNVAKTVNSMGCLAEASRNCRKIADKRKPQSRI